MSEVIKLPGEWSLRRLSLSDRTEWAIQFKGMDWMKIYIADFLPVDGKDFLSEEVRKFAEAMNGR